MKHMKLENLSLVNYYNMKEIVFKFEDDASHQQFIELLSASVGNDGGTMTIQSFDAENNIVIVKSK